MSYFQSFHFPEFFFSQNFLFPEFCILECLISKVFIFRFLASQMFFFCKTLLFRCLFLFSFFSFLLVTFWHNASFPTFFSLNSLFSYFLFFHFLLPRSFFFAKRCISGVLHSGMSYFQSFHFSSFSFPEAFFAEFCAL